MSHRTRVHLNFDQYSSEWVNTTRAQRRAKILWKRHVEKHGNVPMICQCSICSGADRKWEVKHGLWKPSRQVKSVRDENRT